MRTISPRIAEAYVGRRTKTVSRDLNALVEMRLIRRVKGGFVPEFDRLRAFLPYRFVVE